MQTDLNLYVTSIPTHSQLSPGNIELTEKLVIWYVAGAKQTHLLLLSQLIV